MSDIVSPLPFDMTNGTTADASQVMADLNQIRNDVNNNAQHSGAVPSTDAFGSSSGVASGVSIQELGGAVLHKTIITLVNVIIPLTHDAINNTGAYGSAIIYTFPKGVLFQNSAFNCTITKSSAGVSDTWAGHVGLGCVAAQDGDLSGYVKELLFTGGQYVTPPAVAGALTLNSSIGSLNIPINLTSVDQSTTSGNSATVFLNQAVNAADETVIITPCNFITNGTITLIWCNFGDY